MSLRDLLQHKCLGTFEVALQEMRDAETTEQLGDRYARNVDWHACDTVALSNVAEQTAPAVLIEADIERNGRSALLGEGGLNEDQLSAIEPRR